MKERRRVCNIIVMEKKQKELGIGNGEGDIVFEKER